MAERVRLLALSTRATISLLMVGAFLVVLGFFDEFLGWDIFAPPLEKALTGVFASCVALGAFGLAISLAVGIRDVVAAVERLGPPRPLAEQSPQLSRRIAWIWLGSIFASLVVTVIAFDIADQRLLAGRQRMFKRLADRQMTTLAPRWAAELSAVPRPCPACVPAGLKELVRAFDAQSFCRSVDVYLPDPDDPDVLWRYVPDRDGHPELERTLVSRDQERAISQALRRQPAWLNQMNDDMNWISYRVVRGAGGQGMGVVAIFGNSNESYGDYLSLAGEPAEP